MLIKHSLQNNQAGMSMIESLIALLVISIGLLGIAAMQISSLKQSSSAHWSSQAVWYSYEITDRIVANGSAFNTYDGIDTNNDYDMDCEANACSTDQMVTADASDWKEMVSSLPDGRGVITSPAANNLVVSVMWRDNTVTEGDDITESNCPDDLDNTDGMICYTVTVTQ